MSERADTSPVTKIVVVEDLTKDLRPGFGLRRKRVLDRISFSVERGEIFGFVGPNGAGKTTTLKVLMGLIRATSGRAQILGHDVRETAYRRHVGFLPENPYFHDFLTGREFLAFYAKLSGLRRSNRAARIEALLDLVGLREAADARLRTYSKGMLQRIGLAQSLVHDPEVVFLDEPMSGLDPLGRKEIRDLILRLRTEGKTVFMNSHILSDVEMLCDRVAIIAEGRIRYEGGVDAFLPHGESGTDVVATGLAPEAAAKLHDRLGERMRVQGERVELRVPHKQVGELLAELLAMGAEVTSVMPHRASLESIFLSTVQERRRWAR
ncbi:MAG: ABC transporter ATP-binding protein [Deltaproteobacteria bacterium]|nr:MAG: ABC transporter ATP-binding protein [Deltaproteobacteria bacterium]